LCSATRDGDGGGCAGETGGFERVFALEEGDGEGAVETVAGSYGVDGVDFIGSGPTGFAIGSGDVGAFGTALESNGGKTASKEMLGDGFR